MATDEKKLDNPVWFSLKEAHQMFSIEYDDVKFYQPDYCPFGAFTNNGTMADSLDKYAALTDSFYMVGDKPEFNASIKINKEVATYQMIHRNRTALDIDEEIVELGDEHRADLIHLVNLVQPGFFKQKTPELGQYYGIYKNGTLAAVTGERMNMDDYTEVSAVVTHPAHTRNGYAKKLVAHTTNQILARNKTPFLHVSEVNPAAIRLYEQVGFVIRRKISFWHMISSTKKRAQ